MQQEEGHSQSMPFFTLDMYEREAIERQPG